MKAYKITKGQAQALLAVDKRKEMGFNPVKDINGDWFIFEPEANHCFLNFKFEPIEATYIPPPQAEPQIAKNL